MAVFDKIDKEKYSDIWNTPLEIIQALGQFDLDPCSSEKRKWDTAKKHFTISDDGLKQQWEGRVWLNPPYSKAKAFMEKLAKHGDGVAFIYTRVETKMFFDYVWSKADAIFFFRGRVKCYNIDYNLTTSPPASNCLIAYGKSNAEALANCGLDGFFIKLKF
jgi:phage N-6-adenine-methyltransferase